MKLNEKLNDKELKLLNQIEAKGVKIVEFNSIAMFSNDFDVDRILYVDASNSYETRDQSDHSIFLR
uniref:Uncharacterized protein n=1 Tax=Rhizophagus irregularis (strain DAOM 181602 / DAOM 197198 / MUCL 43194) TaxID=747089 RepID=U9T4R0_RHIID